MGAISYSPLFVPKCKIVSLKGHNVWPYGWLQSFYKRGYLCPYHRHSSQWNCLNGVFSNWCETTPIQSIFMATHFMLFRLDIQNMTAQLVSPVICTAMISTVVMRDATQGDVSDHGDVDDMVMIPALGSEWSSISYLIILADSSFTATLKYISFREWQLLSMKFLMSHSDHLEGWTTVETSREDWQRISLARLQSILLTKKCKVLF